MSTEPSIIASGQTVIRRDFRTTRVLTVHSRGVFAAFGARRGGPSRRGGAEPRQPKTPISTRHPGLRFIGAYGYPATLLGVSIARTPARALVSRRAASYGGRHPGTTVILASNCLLSFPIRPSWSSTGGILPLKELACAIRVFSALQNSESLSLTILRSGSAWGLKSCNIQSVLPLGGVHPYQWFTPDRLRNSGNPGVTPSRPPCICLRASRPEVLVSHDSGAVIEH